MEAFSTDRGIKFQGIATCGGLRVAEHNTNFHPDLVNENQGGMRLGNRAGQFP